MGTIVYSCGCSVSTSMFGIFPILDVSPCMKHTLQVQDELKTLANKIKNFDHLL